MRAGYLDIPPVSSETSPDVRAPTSVLGAMVFCLVFGSSPAVPFAMPLDTAPGILLPPDFLGPPFARLFGGCASSEPSSELAACRILRIVLMQTLTDPQVHDFPTLWPETTGAYATQFYCLRCHLSYGRRLALKPKELRLDS